MKHVKLFVLLFASLVTASILYAQRKSSTAPQPQQDSTYSTTTNGGTSWTCPMWGRDPVSWHDVRPVELWPVWSNGSWDDVLRVRESCSASNWRCQVRFQRTAAVAIRKIARSE